MCSSSFVLVVLLAGSGPTLTLDEALKRALEGNAELKVTRAELQVAQAHIRHHFQARDRGGNFGEQGQGFFHGHIQHLRNIKTAIFDRQGLFFEAPATAGRAAHFHFGQEVHFDGQGASAFAALAASAGDVE